MQVKSSHVKFIFNETAICTTENYIKYRVHDVMTLNINIKTQTEMRNSSAETKPGNVGSMVYGEIKILSYRRT